LIKSKNPVILSTEYIAKGADKKETISLDREQILGKQNMITFESKEKATN
jgi:hypothetical protein